MIISMIMIMTISAGPPSSQQEPSFATLRSLITSRPNPRWPWWSWFNHDYEDQISSVSWSRWSKSWWSSQIINKFKTRPKVTLMIIINYPSQSDQLLTITTMIITIMIIPIKLFAVWSLQDQTQGDHEESSLKIMIIMIRYYRYLDDHDYHDHHNSSYKTKPKVALKIMIRYYRYLGYDD